jgi:hypothetical protein
MELNVPLSLLQMQEEVTIASETSDAFSDEALKEYTVFQYAKQAEMKDMLANVADGQIEMYRQVCLLHLRYVGLSREWCLMIRMLMKAPFRLDRQCASGRRLYRRSRALELAYNAKRVYALAMLMILIQPMLSIVHSNLEVGSGLSKTRGNTYQTAASAL